MSRRTFIQWTDYSWSPWWGCTPVSPGCANCYAAAWAKFTRGLIYRSGVPRQRTKDWSAPLKWNAALMRKALAGEDPVRPRVFPSMCDPFDDEVPVQWRYGFFALMGATPFLDWLLLTKRPELMAQIITSPMHNVWAGVSVENQEQADKRIPILLTIPAKVRFLSVEPILERISLRHLLGFENCGEGTVHWAIFGGESGRGARPCNVEWIRDGVRQCRELAVSPFVKQMGSNFVDEKNGICGHSTKWPFTFLPHGPTYRLKDPKGGDPAEWEKDLRVREFPQSGFAL